MGLPIIIPLIYELFTILRIFSLSSSLQPIWILTSESFFSVSTVICYYNPGDLSFIHGTNPSVYSATIACCCSFDVAVIYRIHDLGVFWVPGPFWPVYDYFMLSHECFKPFPEIQVLSSPFLFSFILKSFLHLFTSFVPQDFVVAVRNDSAF